MADKKEYYKLDEIGIIGKQEKKSSASQQHRAKKTGEVFRQARSASSNQRSRQFSKVKTA